MAGCRARFPLPHGERQALLFTLSYAVFVTANYVVQFASVIPLKRMNTSGAIEMKCTGYDIVACYHAKEKV